MITGKMKTGGEDVGKNSRKFSCELCDFSCKNSSDLMQHQQILHKDERLFSCNFCHYSCTKASFLRLHMQIHSAEYKFSCAHCDMKFGGMQSLKRHLQNHMQPLDASQRAKFECSTCSKTFLWKSKYLKHILKHKNPNVYRCQWCDFTACEIWKLTDHTYNHETETGFVCVECGRASSTLAQHEIHMLLYHEQKYLDRINCEQIYPCILCGELFIRFSDLKQHVVSIHVKDHSPDVQDFGSLQKTEYSFAEKKLLCSTCGVLLRTASALKIHKCKTLERKAFPCSTCQRTFPTRAQLRSHELVHSGQKPFACSQCLYRCQRMQYLRRHMLLHSGEKTHLCTTCGESFIFFETLKRHMHKHSTEQPFACDRCNFTTSDPNGLTRHMVKHIDNLLSCDVCSFSCIREVEMIHHKKTHVQDSIIPCSSCHLTFSNSKELQAHMLTHLVQNPPNYSCNLCSFTCQLQKDYVTHMQTHSINKPFTCSVCDYRSNRRMNLKVHMRKQHSMPLVSIISFTCKVCQFTCERDQDFIKHMLVAHSIDKPFDCPVCPFATHRQGLLKVHMETHKPHGFFCDLCDFKCKRRTLLNKHMIRKHRKDNSDENVVPANEQRIYMCKICDFVSKHYASLRNHMPIHSNVKFPCDQCNYVTYSQRNLMSHKRAHIKDKPYKCPFCQYASARKNNFKLHMVKHKDERLYCCNKCDFTSKSDADLISHGKCCHGEVLTIDNKSTSVIVVLQSTSQNDSVMTKGANVRPSYPSSSTTQTGCLSKSNQDVESLSTYTTSNHVVATLSLSASSIQNKTDRSSVLQRNLEKDKSLNTSNLFDSHMSTVSSDNLPQNYQLRPMLSQTGQTDSICLHPFTPMNRTERSATELQLPMRMSYNLPQKNVIVEMSQSQNGISEKPCDGISSADVEAAQNQYKISQGGHVQTSQHISVFNDLPQYIYHPAQNISLQYHEDPPDSESAEIPHTEACDTSQALTTHSQVMQYDYTSKDARDFSQHMANLLEGNIYSCQICNFKGSSEEELKDHSTAAHSTLSPVQMDTTFDCTTCKLSFLSADDLARHSLQSHFERGLSEDQHQQDLPDICEPQTQDQTFSASIAENTQIGERLYTCTLCRLEHDRPSEFKRHMLKAHSIEKAFSCTLCGYKSKREDDLRTHAITHDVTMIRSCSVCDYTCKREPALRKHMRKHTDVKLFSCNLCNFWCNYEPDLKTHEVKVHKKPKQLVCHLCSFTSDFAVHFKKHMSVAHVVENAFRCPYCDYSTSVWNNFRAHRLKHSNMKRYICRMCNQSFKRSSGLKNHIQTHSKIKSFTCLRCNYQCDTTEKLNIHMRRHTNECPFVCRLCRRSYNHSSSLYKHIALVHKNAKKHTCSWCSYATSTVTLLKRHHLTHGVGRKFKCRVCHFACNHTEVLENHKLVHNPEIILPASLETDGKTTSSSLADTNIVTSSQDSLHHAQSESADSNGNPSSVKGPSRFACSTCNHTFSSTSNFKKHMLRHERSQYVNKFTCSVCEFSCLRPFELKIHTSVHTGEKLFSCDQCDFSCNKPYTLKYHKEKKHCKNICARQESSGLLGCHLCSFTCGKRIHMKYHMQVKHKNPGTNIELMESPQAVTSMTNAAENSSVSQTSSTSAQNIKSRNKENSSISGRKTPERYFICDLCNYSTRNKGNLLTHMQKHEDKKFLCHLCDYMCRRERELARHLLTHEKGKPLSCTLCSYTCIQSANLKVHMLKHRGDRPIQCELCSFRCRQKSTLRDHMTTHSDERKFACDKCDYKAKRAASLKMHMFTHSSARPVCCNLCDFTCKHVNALRSHMRSHAPDQRAANVLT